MAILVCFAGQIGSGKTSISTTVALALRWKRASFGDFLRAEVVRRGGNPDHRETLQDLGQSCVTRGPEDFCRQVLASGQYRSEDNFILDGVRHVDIHFALQRVVAPTPVKLIFLMAEDEVRRQRVAARDGSLNDLARAEVHPVEADIRVSLPNIASAKIDGTASVDEVLKNALETIRSWM